MNRSGPSREPKGLSKVLPKMPASKKVFLINQFFYPDIAATSQLLGDLARWLAARKWNVVAITGRGNYASAGRPADDASAPADVLIRRVWCTNFGRGNLIGRLCDYLTFLLSAAITVALASKPDVVVCLSTPPFVALLGLIAKVKGSRFVYKVEDLYPDVAVALSTLNERSLITRLLARLSRLIVRNADSIVALDEAMTDRLRTTGARSVDTIPNWADGQSIRPDNEARRIFRTAHDLEGRLVLLYSGNLGLAHRFDALMEAAKQCASTHPEVLFLFVGNGVRLNEVQSAAMGLSNVRFMDYQPRETLNLLYNAADIHVVTLRDEVSGLLFPSKYPAALAAGKPVLLIGGQGAPFQCEIQNKNLGWACTHDVRAITAVIQDALNNPRKLEIQGRNARQVFDARYSKSIAMEHWEQVLDGVVKQAPIPAKVFEKKKAVSVRSYE